MVSHDNYSPAQVEACKAVLIEVIHIMGEFKDEMAVIGGWVPALLLPESKEQHIGTLDVDIALNFQNISDDTYATILQALTDHGYSPSDKQPYIFTRDVVINAKKYTVQVDILSPEYGGSSKNHRTQSVQDIKARKARGCDLVFNNFKTIQIEGELPTGGINKVQCKIASAVPFLVMKGMALADRKKEKDAYDIEYLIHNFPGGAPAVAKLFSTHMTNSLVLEGLGKIRDKFLTAEHIGPIWVIQFLKIQGASEQAIRQRAAFERVSQFLDMLSVKPFL
jgi:hypothetical protein